MTSDPSVFLPFYLTCFNAFPDINELSLLSSSFFTHSCIPLMSHLFFFTVKSFMFSSSQSHKRRLHLVFSLWFHFSVPLLPALHLASLKQSVF